MKIFLAYLKSKSLTIGAWGLFAVIFAAVFVLNNLPPAVVGYAAVLCLFCGAVLGGLDFAAFRRRHYELQQQLSYVDVSLENLPRPADLVEADYQQALQVLRHSNIKLTEEAACRYSDMVDYYTLWAHQIKTPIAAMRLLLQDSQGLSAAQTAQNRELLGELQRIEQYVEMVLCYLRLESDSTDYVIREYDLDSIVRQAVRKFASQFIRRKLILHYEPLNCRVLTDEKWLLFVLEQLLANALKYTKEGSIRITLEPQRTLCLSDTGIGIAAEDLPRVFEKGFTGYNGREDKKASGLGLYLCSRIMRQLGHTISLQSVVGQGTTVRLGLASEQLEPE